MIITRDGATFGTKSKAIFLTGGKSAAEAMKSPADYAAPRPGYEERLGEVAMWGLNNNLPMEMMADIEATGVLSAGIDAKARITIGKGPMPAKIVSVDKNGQEELAFVNNAEIALWLETHRAFETSFAVSKDLYGYGNAFVQILLSADRKQILGFKRCDPTQCRFSRIDDATGKSEFVYMSADWQRWYSLNDKEKIDKDKHISKIPLLDKDYPLLDLQSRTSGYTFMVAIQYPLTGRNYYAPSPWYCAKKWVGIAQSIPEMKVAVFKNQMTLRYVVEIHPKFWEGYSPLYASATAAGKKVIQDDYFAMMDEALSGNDNAYKSIISTKIPDPSGGAPMSGVTVTPIADNMKDGKFAPDGAAANSEILFALMINPALMGADSPGGPYSGGAGSGSNIREAMLVQVMLGETERRMNSTVFNLAKAYNGWDPQLVLRYPNQILTTLNTGANTAPVA